MNKKYFTLYLLPTRNNFAETMTEQERGIMLKHVAYWTDQMNKGVAIVFGPVFDPKETYGLGIVAVDDEAQVKELIANDPAAQINRYEYYPLHAMVAGHQG